MFERISTMNAYLQQQKLSFAAKYKMKTGQRLEDAAKKPSREFVSSMMQAQKQADDDAAVQRVSLIKQKLVSGKKISDAELDYLKDRDQSLYKKAKKAEETRAELRARLRNCKTKQEARRAVSQVMVKVAAEQAAELSAAKAASTAKNIAGTGGKNGGIADNFADNFNVGNDVGKVSNNAKSDVKNNVMTVAEENKAAALSVAADAATATKPESKVMALYAANAATGGITVKLFGRQEVAKVAQNSVIDSVVVQPEEHSAVTRTAAGDGAATRHTAKSSPEDVDGAGHENELSVRKAKDETMAVAAQDTRDDLSPQSIMEKYIMLVRAIEDEWANFSATKGYKELPEDGEEDAETKGQPTKVTPATRQTIDMLNAYRAPALFAKEYALFK